MFDLLYPWYFLGTFLIGIPILIHFISYKKIKTIDFAAVSFLFDLQKKKINSYSFQNIFLLILRCLIIFLTILIFTFPQFIIGYTGFIKNSSIVFLIDSSCSMKYKTSNGTLFSEAVNKTIDIIDNLSGKENFTIITTNSDIPLFQTFITDKNIAKNKLKELKCSYSSSHMQKAIILCEQIFKNSNRKNKELCILSDFQKNSFSENITSELRKKGIKIKYIDYSPEIITNACVNSVKILSIPVINKNINIQADIRNYSSHNIDNISADLYINNTLVKRKKISLEKNILLDFTHSFKSAGIHSGYIKITDDNFNEDNIYYFSIPVRKAINPLIISNSSELSNSFFINYALNPSYSALSSIIATTVDQYQLPSSIDPYDVLILADVADINNGLIHFIKKFSIAQKGIFIIADPKINISAYNDLLNEISDVILFKHTIASYDIEKKYKLSFAENSKYMNILSKNNIEDINCNEFVLMQCKQENVIGYFNEEFPAIIKDKNILIYSFSLNKKYSDIAISTYFLPILHESIYSLITFETPLQAFIDETIQINISSVWFTNSQKIEIISPENRSFHLSASKEKENIVCELTPEIPGMYLLKNIHKTVAANINSAVESDFQKDLNFLKNENVIDKTKLITTDPETILLSKYIVFLVLLLSCIELYYCTKKRTV